METQVRFNSRRSKRYPQRLEWYFLLINKNREIEEISTRIYNLFAPIAEEYQKLEGILKEDLRFKFLHFESERRPDFSQFRGIFKKLIKDVSLYEREDSAGLTRYIHSL